MLCSLSLIPAWFLPPIPRLWKVELLRSFQTVKVTLSEDGSTSAAAMRLAAAIAEREQAERSVAAKFLQLKDEQGPGNIMVLNALRDAQALLSEMRCEEERRRCEEEMTRCTDGASAAEKLDALGSTGVSPDAACYREALRACGSDGHLLPGSSSEVPAEDPSEWAQLLFEVSLSNTFMHAAWLGDRSFVCVFSCCRLCPTTIQIHDPTPRFTLLLPAYGAGGCYCGRNECWWEPHHVLLASPSGATRTTRPDCYVTPLSTNELATSPSSA